LSKDDEITKRNEKILERKKTIQMGDFMLKLIINHPSLREREEKCYNKIVHRYLKVFII